MFLPDDSPCVYCESLEYETMREDGERWKDWRIPCGENHVAILSAHRTVSMVCHTTFTKRIWQHAEIFNTTFSVETSDPSKVEDGKSKATLRKVGYF